MSVRSEGVLVLQSGEDRRADLIVAADGVYSRLRESFYATRLLDYGIEAGIRMLIKHQSGDSEDIITEYWNGLWRLLYNPCTDGENYIFLSAPIEDERGRKIPIDRDFWRETFPLQADLVNRFREDGRWDRIAYVRCRSWSDGRVAILGDAANGMPPNLGQAANMAFTNAMALATITTGGDDVEQSLRDWEAVARPLTEHVQWWSYIYGYILGRWPADSMALRGDMIKMMATTKWFDDGINRGARSVPLGFDGNTDFSVQTTSAVAEIQDFEATLVKEALQTILAGKSPAVCCDSVFKGLSRLFRLGAHAAAGGGVGILQQAGDGHGADAAGNRGDRAGDLGRLIEGDIADKFGLVGSALDPVDADIDDRGAGFDPIAVHHFGPSGGDHQDIGGAAFIGEIAGARVRHGDGAVLAHQELRHWLADQVGPSQHQCFLAFERAQRALEQDQAAERGTGDDAIEPGHEPAGIDDVKAVDIFIRIDRIDDNHGINVIGERQLDQDPMYRGIGIERGERGQQVILFGVGRQFDIGGHHARLLCRLAFVADIDGAGGVVTNQDDGEPGGYAVLGFEVGDPFGKVGAQFSGHRFAVDNRGSRHRR